MMTAGDQPYGGITRPTSQPLDRDRLYMIRREVAAQAAFMALDPLQKQRPEVMVAGPAVLFAALCLRCGLDPAELHAFGLRVLRSTEPFHKRNNDSLQSLQDFAGIRILGHDDVSIS